MIWPFKRRKAQSVQTAAGSTHGEIEPPDATHSPSLSAFSFSSIRADSIQEERAEPAVDASESDTAVDVTPVASGQQLQDVIRERSAPRRQFTFQERGVRPALVPSLREHTTCIRLVAESLAYDQPAESIVSWKEYLSFCPRDSAAWFALGQSAVTVEDFGLARRAFEHVIELDGQHGLAYGALGFVFAQTGHLEHAFTCYKKAVHLRPTCDDMKAELVRLCEHVGEFELAGQLRQQLDLGR
ncbi:MAG: hypothetical protein VYA30_10080 [Myxococcota bacterium]|nr:hypothetical protein [Myxococcota bacterium]